MPNVAPTDPRASKTRSRLLRALLWLAVSAVALAVFFGYQQVDLAIAWITAKLC